MMREKLKDIERQLALCIKCKKCTYGDWPNNLPMCPPYNKFGFYTYCGGGMLYLGRAILLNLIEPSPEALEVISKCTMCGFCGEICELVKVTPPHLPVHELINIIKAELIEQGIDISKRGKAVFDSIKKEKNPFGVSYDKRLKAHETFLNPKAKVMIFSGCFNTLKRKNTLDPTLRILEKAQVDFRLLGDEWCCGAPLLDMGYRKEIAELAEHNIKEIVNTRVEKVVFLCPHCLSIFSSFYPQITTTKISAELTYVTQFILDLARKNIVKFSNSSKPHKKVAFHDPCYLARYIGDVQSVRELLKCIPSVELVEMKRNRNETYCCGAGGGVKISDPDYAEWIGKERLKEFIDTGASELITSCPHCVEHFWDVSGEMGFDFPVRDSLEIILEYISK
jgi:heterodisulfide reductase subunit D